MNWIQPKGTVSLAIRFTSQVDIPVEVAFFCFRLTRENSLKLVADFVLEQSKVPIFYLKSILETIARKIKKG